MTETLTTELDLALNSWPIFGASTPIQQGINSSGDALATHTVDNVDLNEIWEDVITAMTEWNQHRTQISSLLAFNTTVPGEAVPQGIATPSFDKLTEYGLPTTANVPASGLILGYDFADFGQRAAFTWRALRGMTAEQVYATINGVLHSDNRLVTGTILRRLFDPTAKINGEGFTCKGLYNADGEVPPPFLGREFTDISHYIASGNATLDSADIEDAMNLVRSKGYGLGNGSQLLILAHPYESEQIQTFRAGELSRPSGPIAKHSWIPSKLAPAYLQPDNIIGEPIEGTFHDIEVLGSYGPAWLIETPFVPEGYVAVVASGGPNAQANVIGVREHPVASYRGLLAVGGNPNYPIQDSTYIRSFGTGTRQRGGAAVIQVTAGSTYAAPTIAI